MPRNQDIGKATPNDRQDASDDNHSEASRAGDTAGQEDDQDFSPRFPLNQGELPPALPDDMVILVLTISNYEMKINIARREIVYR